MANIRWRQNITGGSSTHSFNILDDELSKFVGVDVRRFLTNAVETDENKITARARGDTIFDLNGPLLHISCTVSEIGPYTAT